MELCTQDFHPYKLYNKINDKSPITHVELEATQNRDFTVIFMSCWSLSMNKIHQGVKNLRSANLVIL